MTKMQSLLQAIDMIADDLVANEMERAGFINAEDLARRLLNRLSLEQKQALMDQGNRVKKVVTNGGCAESVGVL